jgi:hypothetical protein
MSTSIIEQILTGFGSQLETILTANQYETQMGANVYRHYLPSLNSDVVPCVGYSTGLIENSELYHRRENLIVPVRVQGVAEFSDSVIASKMAVKVYADICECVLGPVYAASYTSGGTVEIVAGNVLTGDTSGAQSLVISVTLDSGTWAGGNASGAFVLRRLKGTFSNNEILNVGVSSNVATLDGLVTGQMPVETITGGIAEQITFFGGELVLPESDHATAGANIVFHVRAKVMSGNPYSQT